MGKDRKLKKGRQEEDFGEEEVDNENLNSEESSTAGSKKRKSKKKDDNDKTTDLVQKVESLSLEDLDNQKSKPSNKKEGKKNKSRAEKNKGDDSEDEIYDNKSAKKSDKKRIVGDDNDNIIDDNTKSSKRKGKKGKEESDDDDEIHSKQSKGKKGKSKIVISDDETENQDQKEEKFSQKKQKGKKSKSERSDDDGDDDEEIVPIKDNKSNKKSRKGKSELIDDDEEIISIKDNKSNKKSRKGKSELIDNDDDDLIEKNVKTSKKQKGKKFSEEISDDESEKLSNTRTKKKDDQKKSRESKVEINEENVTRKKPLKTKSVFELLDVEDDDMDLEYDDDSRNDESNKNMAELKKQSSEEQDDNALGKAKDEKLGKKSKKKERKKKHDDDDEVEKMLEELALEIEGKKPVSEKTKEDSPENIELDSKAEESEKSSKKKKKKKADTEASENRTEETGVVLDNEKEEHTVKTAAQKKKEKKEKEKEKKKSQKSQEHKKNEAEVETEVPVAEKALASTEIDAEEKDDADDDDGKQKKKKKKKGVEDEKKDKKRPGKKQILAMQEALKKLKEEEERLKLEEEAKQRAAEEAEQKRQEQLRLEQERKERKKQKEKEKRERLKAEGKILTKSQKQSRARMEATLSALRLQGVEVPQIGEKRERAPRLGDKRKFSKKKPTETQTEQKEVTTPEETTLPQVKVEIVSQTEVKEDNIAEEKIKESWEDKDDVKDAWDESSEDEEEDDDEGEKETQHEAKDKISQEINVKKEESEESEEEEDDEAERDDDDDDEDDESSEESDDDRNKQEKIKERVQERIQRRREEAEKKRSVDKLRSPVVCVLGHVDTGKTKILDKIRRTHVQDNEAGGITQQIGATMVPQEALKEQCKMVKNFPDIEIKLPGLLIIDTPGHESFSNLRSRGSSLCDIAILVVDIMHGLEPQTLESINLLKQKKTPFVVALNKIDRLYDWKSNRNKDIQDIIKSQARNTKLEYEERVREIVVQFAEQGLNAALSYENKDARTYISMVPTSAFTGEGMGNLMALIVELSQTMMAKRLAFTEELQATVLEVKAIPGLGTTIDVILVNGRLKEGDTIVVAGQEGPVVTQIRSLLMPEPLKELRVKNPYNDYKEVEGAQGVKIAGKDLEKAIAGLQLLVAYHPDEVELLKEEVANSLRDAINSIKLAERGVYVQASTLGSLEALLEFLRTSKIPYAGVRIGPVVKKDVMKASIMLEHETQYAVILAFDVKVERDAEELAENLGVRVFQANIIYHLFDRFTAYQDELHQKKRDEYKNIAVFPCKLRILPQYIFNSRDPIVIGVSVEAGVVKEGTPICVPGREFLDIGTVTTLELNHKSVTEARKGQEICIKIEAHSGEAPKMYGRHFDETDTLVSKITRQSIDACKNYFRDDLQKSDWQLMVELKKLFQIL